MWAVGSWGSVPSSGSAAAPVPQRRRKEGPCAAVGAACCRTRAPWASALSHAAPRAAVVCGGPGARAQLVSQLCHRSVSQDESESLWAEPCPSGVTALPLAALPPSRALGAAHPRAWGTQSPAMLLPAQGCPQVHSWWQGVGGTQLPRS